MMGWRKWLMLAGLAVLMAACGEPAPREWESGTYEGLWQAGKPEGYGRYVARRGHMVYEGEWKNGLPDGYGAWQRGDSTYRGRFVRGRFEGMGRLTVTGGACYEGSWQSGRRSGPGVWRSPNGAVFSGCWVADSLPSGRRVDSTGTYQGSFDRRLRPLGFGRFDAADGLTHYEGHWSEGRRTNFGVGYAPGGMVKSGVWKGDRFRGERMRYTADRVYGIDISRYQHEHGRKRYGIRWRQLRIRYLGHAHNSRIVGRSDFPVSFCYIKSTQGVRLRSRYYAADSRGARAVGIKVGAYHFMTTASGRQQALHFLRRTPIRRGDLPPMLDVELTSKQIARMGGRAAMFREMLAWLRVVGSRTGTKPIIYVGQSFVDRHLSHAPAALLDYDVWIARYGAYKPYVHLLYWQLSPHGRVAGIRGEVDINVFNGTKEQFQQYVLDNAVKRVP